MWKEKKNGVGGLLANAFAVIVVISYRPLRPVCLGDDFFFVFTVVMFELRF